MGLLINRSISQFIVITAIFVSLNILPPLNRLCLAGVTTDGSLGPEVSLTGPDFAITHDLGQIRGANLYHSFRELSIEAGESATFSGPATIENIISRVTGGDISYIDGLLRSTIDGADFFLLNPSGILFGPHAQLDIKGSFHAGTANYLRFEDDAVFRADPAGHSVLSVAAPEAFGFLDANPGPISVDDSWLSVSPGERISLTGGDLNIVGGNFGVRILAPQGEIQLVGVCQAGEVHLNSPELLADTNGQGGAINIADAALSDSYDAARTVIIKGGRIQISNSSVAAEGTRTADVGGPSVDMASASSISMTDGSSILCFSGGTEKGRGLWIKAEELTMGDTSWIDVIAADMGPGGDITLDTQLLTLSGDSLIQVSSYAGGASGTLQIDAAAGVSLADSASIESGAYSLGAGGDIHIGTPALTLEDDAGIQAWSLGSGDGGSIRLDATGEVWLGGASMIKSSAYDLGDGGSVRIDAETLTLENGALIAVTASAGGACGSMEITAHGSLSVDGSGSELYSPKLLSVTIGSSAAGDIHVSTSALDLLSGGTIASTSSGEGGAGTLTLSAESIFMDDGFINSGGDAGSSGDVIIRAHTFEAVNNSSVTAATMTAGSAGTIDLAAQKILLDGSGIYNDTIGAGTAGDIQITADQLVVQNEALIESATLGDGSGGTISIKADELTVDGLTGGRSTVIATISAGAGDAGDIKIDLTHTLRLLDGGAISANAYDAGNAGEIEITAPTILLAGADPDMPSSIESSCALDATGSGGQIRLQAADALRLEGQAHISAYTRGRADAGSIEIDAGEISLNGGSIEGFTSGPGDGGTIHIGADRLTIQGGNGITGETQGSGKGGDIIIQCAGDVTVDAAEVTTEGAGGAGGDIHMRAANFSFRNNASITAKSAGAGNAGNVYLNAADNISSVGSTINTRATHADGGNIRIESEGMTRFVDGGVTASVGGGAGTTGGNVELQSRYVILQKSQLTANAYEGHGGSINITAAAYLADPASIVDASSALGIDGMVDIRAPFGNLSGSLKPLPKEFLIAADLLKEPCEARVRGGDYGSFMLRGRDARPDEPGWLQMSPPLEF